MNRLTKYFFPAKATHLPTVTGSKNVMELTSKSQRLMLNLGLIEHSSAGNFFLLPFAQRSVDKLISVINDEFTKLGAMKITMPCLTQASLWKKSGRYEKNVGELFHLRNRHDKQYILSPTHEESITHLLSSIPPLSLKQLPLYLYQISPKFRDELKPRFGIIRSNEFLMADLYSFDCSIEAAEKTYSNLRSAIKHIFKRLGVYTIEVKSLQLEAAKISLISRNIDLSLTLSPESLRVRRACTVPIKVQGDSGMMGGDLSHEIHVLSDIGDDLLQYCSMCEFAANKSIQQEPYKCEKCKSSNLKDHKGIELAHTFLLGEKYSKSLGAQFRTSENKWSPFIMGSYGIGVSRTVGAVTEVLSTDDQLRWPLSLAPFSVCIIPPKAISDAQEMPSLVEKLYNALNDIEELKGDIILDDRNHMTIGKRLIEVKRLGFPFIIILGKSAFESIPTFEIHDVSKNECNYLELPDILKFLSEKYSVQILPKSVFVNQFV